jgi:hypothetical protein
MPTSLVYEHNFARVTAIDGARVALAYDLDPGRWPWLALPTHHPVLVEKYQYFSGVTAGAVVDPASSTTVAALTRFRWSCTPAAWRGHHPTTGTCEPWGRDGRLGFTLVIGDAEGHDVYVASGEGFVFADRDFPAWRERSRRAATAHVHAPTIEPAPASAVGLGPGGRSFVTMVEEAAGRPTVTALVPTSGGFHPDHPFHTGSGDHVNAGHLFDCVLQAAHLFLGGQHAVPLACTGGEAQFLRFVELDVPFTIALRRRDPGADAHVRLEVSVAQVGRENAVIALALGPGATTGNLARGSRSGMSVRDGAPTGRRDRRDPAPTPLAPPASAAVPASRGGAARRSGERPPAPA